MIVSCGSSFLEDEGEGVGPTSFVTSDTASVAAPPTIERASETTTGNIVISDWVDDVLRTHRLTTVSRAHEAVQIQKICEQFPFVQ